MIKRIVASLVLACSTSLASAAVVADIDQAVTGKDNLYYTNWGHWWTTAEDNALYNPDSVAARAVSVDGHSFNFADFTYLDISATGMVVDHFGTPTDANGDTCNPTCLFKDGHWRGLPVYSLIGIWSTSPDEIIPLGNPQTSAFFIGTAAQLIIPDNYSSLYLFLAENDGGFSDNSGHYDVHLHAVNAVPTPAAWTLFMSGIAGLQLVRRRRNAQA